jgi:hypothetical protein
MIHSIQWHDLQFDRVIDEFRSTRGVKQIRLVEVGVPRIPQNVLKSVFYLYESKKDARAGLSPGGTGFVVSCEVPAPHLHGRHFCYYGVTNWHVACRGASIIRLNTKDGGTDIISFGPEEWHFIPGKYDIAVIPLALDSDIHDVSAVSIDTFASPPEQYDYLGVGEDVFMIGLFVDHAGVATNIPSARFGNISMLPNPRATFEQETGFRSECFIVDMHSRTGFSGSPVYVYRTFGNDFQAPFGEEHFGFDVDNMDEILRDLERQRGHHIRLRGRVNSDRLFQLLGIHTASFPEKWELKRLKKPITTKDKNEFDVDGRYIEGKSGMTVVIPAWHIVEVLNMPIIQELRAASVPTESEDQSVNPVPESRRPSEDASPTHKEDFTSLLNAAAKTKPQDGQT